MIFLDRAYLPDNGPTLGKLTLPEWSCLTLERRWLQNQKSVSCIPEGTYTLEMRDSPLVERLTKGAFKRGWEVTNVADRTYIMFHPGNFEKDTDGCPLVGRKFSWTEREGHMVTQSQNTFTDFMTRMAVKESWTLVVRPVWAGW